jgi:hypothetical protein
MLNGLPLGSPSNARGTVTRVLGGGSSVRKTSYIDNQSTKSRAKERALTKFMNKGVDHLTKHQALLEVDKIKQRIEENERRERSLVSTLPVTEQIRATREERILQRHERAEGRWRNFIERASEKLERDAHLSTIV